MLSRRLGCNGFATAGGVRPEPTHALLQADQRGVEVGRNLLRVGATERRLHVVHRPTRPRSGASRPPCRRSWKCRSIARSARPRALVGAGRQSCRPRSACRPDVPARPSRQRAPVAAGVGCRGTKSRRQAAVVTASVRMEREPEAMDVRQRSGLRERCAGGCEPRVSLPLKVVRQGNTITEALSSDIS
jgi:hypothetical protein